MASTGNMFLRCDDGVMYYGLSIGVRGGVVTKLISPF